MYSIHRSHSNESYLATAYAPKETKNANVFIDLLSYLPHWTSARPPTTTPPPSLLLSLHLLFFTTLRVCISFDSHDKEQENSHDYINDAIHVPAIVLIISLYRNCKCFTALSIYFSTHYILRSVCYSTPTLMWCGIT